MQPAKAPPELFREGVCSRAIARAIKPREGAIRGRSARSAKVLRWRLGVAASRLGDPCVRASACERTRANVPPTTSGGDLAAPWRLGGFLGPRASVAARLSPRAG